MSNGYKAQLVKGLLEQGHAIKTIKKVAEVSESYVYMLKKQLKEAAQEAVEEIKTTVLDTSLSWAPPAKPKPGEFVQADTNVDAILNERGNTYGSFEDVANVAQEFKNIAYDSLKARQKTIYADQAEALDMIFSKIARIINGNPDQIDSWVDIAGYAQLVADRLQGKVR
jgi:transposase-like protein